MLTEIGSINGKKVYKATLSSATLSAEVISYGALLSALTVNTNKAQLDVVLGLDCLDEYLLDTASLGRTVGRVCNRIKDAVFVLNGKQYNLDKNKGNNCLHGGSQGFGSQVWDIKQTSENKVELCYFSKDGEQGFPGNMQAKVTYTVDGDTLIIEHSATCDQDTIVSMTNHAYFNLNGQGSGSALNHKVKISSNELTPVDSTLCPFNEFMSVKGTPFDFTDYKTVGLDIDKEHPLLSVCNGYDINYMLNGDISQPVASVIGDKSGVKMDIYTNQKGMHFYSANFLKPISAKSKKFDKRHALCFETQCPPNAINCDKYPSPILRKGEVYCATTKFKFSQTDKEN